VLVSKQLIYLFFIRASLFLNLVSDVLSAITNGVFGLAF
jgi:hypothetical protein